MTAIRSIKYILCILEQMKRSYIEVSYRAGSDNNSGVCKQFASSLREKYGGTDNVEKYNERLLDNLMRKGHIPKSSVIWHQDKIVKIYGFKVDEEGKVVYDIAGSHSPNRKAKTYVTNTPNIDMSAVRNGILRSKQVAI